MDSNKYYPLPPLVGGQWWPENSGRKVGGTAETGGSQWWSQPNAKNMELKKKGTVATHLKRTQSVCGGPSPFSMNTGGRNTPRPADFCCSISLSLRQSLCPPSFLSVVDVQVDGSSSNGGRSRSKCEVSGGDLLLSDVRSNVVVVGTPFGGG